VPSELQVLSTVISILGGVIGIFLVAVIPLQRKLRAMIDSWEIFMRDWKGEPELPGRGAVPGVMERLNKLDGQLSKNGGSSLKDSVDRIEAKLNRMDSRISRVEKKLDQKDQENE
jgi:hypothetical protein